VDHRAKTDADYRHQSCSAPLINAASDYVQHRRSRHQQEYEGGEYEYG
jgi:hypothetical protein